MNGLMIKALAFSAVLIIATIYVVMSLDIDIFADSINAITMGGAIAIAVLASGVSVKYINQMKTDTATGELAEENWDGIGEYTNELPSGWAYSFLGAFLWSMWYGFIGYPVNAYSQIGEYNAEVLAYNKKFEATHKNPSMETLQKMGKSIYLVQCQQCHGLTGDGLSGRAQNFTSRMSKEQVLDIIKKGSNQLAYPMGSMPPMMASGQDAIDVAEYISKGLKGTRPAGFAVCASCHGEDGKGNGGMSPNLVIYDDIIIDHVLTRGKKGTIGQMPSFKAMITPVQERALTVYIQSLSN